MVLPLWSKWTKFLVMETWREYVPSSTSLRVPGLCAALPWGGGRGGPCVHPGEEGGSKHGSDLATPSSWKLSELGLRVLTPWLQSPPSLGLKGGVFHFLPSALHHRLMLRAKVADLVSLSQEAAPFGLGSGPDFTSLCMCLSVCDITVGVPVSWGYRGPGEPSLCGTQSGGSSCVCPVWWSEVTMPPAGGGTPGPLPRRPGHHHSSCHIFSCFLISFHILLKYSSDHCFIEDARAVLFPDSCVYTFFWLYTLLIVES